MTSSTSGSDGAARARRWLGAFFGTLLGGAALVMGALVLIDPYDSGRFPGLRLAGVSDANLRTADVSRGRDQRFDSAVFGSSTGQSIDPRRLSAATGRRFTQMAITGAGPREELALLDWFVAHHARPGALVIAADAEWCSDDPALPVRYPFPFWLYGGDAGYLANLLNWKSFDHAAWRVQLALGRRRAIDPEGFFPYVARTDAFEPLPPYPPELGAVGAPFPWIEQLAGRAARLPGSATLVVLMPPVVRDFLPAPGSAAAGRLEACKQRVAGLLRGYGGFIDDRVDSPLAGDPGNFYDRVHYRPGVARGIEAQIIEQLMQSAGERHDVAGR